MSAGARSHLTRAQRDHRAEALLGEAPNATATVAIGGTVLKQRCVVSETRIRLITALFDRHGNALGEELYGRAGVVRHKTRLLWVELDTGETVLDLRS